MENAFEFIGEHLFLCIFLWWCTGQIFFWAGVLIRQIFYRRKNGGVALMFSAIKFKGDGGRMIFLSVFACGFGPFCLILTFNAIGDVWREAKRLRQIEETLDTLNNRR